MLIDDNQLQQFVLRVKQLSPEQANSEIANFVEQILRFRQVSRSTSKAIAFSISLEILQALRTHLHQSVEQAIVDYNPVRTPIREWIRALLNDAYRVVLDRQRLQQLAIEIQGCAEGTETWLYGRQELVKAIRLSDKLAQINRLPFDAYEDAVNETLLWVCQNLKSYSAERGDFMKWVNFRLDMVARRVQQQQEDPYTQGAKGRVIRMKQQIQAHLRDMKLKKQSYQIQSTALLSCLIDCLRLHLKNLHLKTLLPKEKVLNLAALLQQLWLLITHLNLSQFLEKYPDLEHQTLFNLATMLVSSPPKLIQNVAAEMLEAVPQEEHTPSLAEQLRRYFERDPQALLRQRTMRDRPDITLREVGLSYLNGISWQAMSEAYGVKLATLSNFYQRSIEKLAPAIRQALQE
ncbi:hypothetical protein [Leptolyngbya sp. FACHB-711]|uniref:hypothetical protein n=1 Tax=Leptolyngbya sp. FACHB-711 TaxID=2692813 RepID=UPI0016890C0D|nr:hypothetical protein [Leptolyngbya sp. FACHB-711]MBD2028201.1 hypothetical protein [Leptolyngbya sp. FACHB-711]